MLILGAPFTDGEIGLLTLLPFINTVDKTQLHTQNGNSKSHEIQKSVFTHDSLSLNNLLCYS